MPKAATSRMANTRAAVKAAQCKRYERDLRRSSSQTSSCIAGSSSTSVLPYQWPKRVPAMFSASQSDVDASTVAAKALAPYSGERSPARTGKWPTDHWFWMLLVSLPAKMEGRMALIQTFNAYYYGKHVHVKNSDGPWSDPFFDLVFIACELFLPYDPYGGRGSSRSISIFGDKKSRNETICFILNLAIGVIKDKVFGENGKKIISSKIQTVMKTLLTNYNDINLSAEVRRDAGMALKHLAQGHPLGLFYATLRRKKGDPPRKLDADALILDESLQTPTIQRVPSYHSSLVVELHPFLAWIISKNRFFIDEASLSIFFNSTSPVHFLSGNLPARTWWSRHVMVDSNEKANSARDWWRRELKVAGDCYQSRMVLAENFDKVFTNMRHGVFKEIAEELDLPYRY